MKKLFGRLSDLWTIPLALIIAFCYNYITTIFGMFSMTPEKIGKIIPATVLILLALGISRLIHMIQYPEAYKYGLMKNKNKAWVNLSEEKKFYYSWRQRVVLFLALVILLLL